MPEVIKFRNKPAIDRDFYKYVTRVSRVKTVLLCVLIYAAVVGLAYVGGEYSSWWLAPLSILIIGGLQNHLLIVFHEGSHWLMHPDRKWNDFWTDLFCGAPLFQFVRNYRLFHWNHHRNTGKKGEDPELEIYEGQGYFYKRRNGLETFKMLLMDITGVNLLKFQASMSKYLTRNVKENQHKVATSRELLLLLLVWVPTIAVVWYFELWLYLVVFWILPLVTVTFVLLKLHAYGEHTGLDGPTEFERTWFHGFNPIVDFFIYPIYSGYHIEHHIFPTVPWYKMKEFRQHLLKNPYYQKVSDKVSADGFFFGKKTIWSTMIYGEGLYTDSDYFQKELKERNADIQVLKDQKESLD